MRKWVKSALATILAAVFFTSCSGGNGQTADSSDKSFRAAVEVFPQSEADEQNEPTDKNRNYTSMAELLECRFFIEQDFYRHVGQAAEYSCKAPLCGIVPHHLLAGRMIAGFLKAASKSDRTIDTIVITAPVHEPLRAELLTTKHGWKTPFGEMETNKEVTEQFISELGATVDDDMLEADHSAAGLVPYIEHYFPDADIACLLIPKSAARDTPERVSELYEKLSRERSCLFLFSVDFSHYLKPDEAEDCDTRTLRAVLGGEYEAIADMTNDNMDSPHCVNSFLKLSESLNLTVGMLDRSNSAKVSGISYSETAYREGITSYFIFSAE